MMFSELKKRDIKNEIREFLNGIKWLNKEIINQVVEKTSITSSEDITIIGDPYLFDNECTLRQENFNNYELSQKGTLLYGDVSFGEWVEEYKNEEITDSNFEVDDIHIVEIYTYEYDNGQITRKTKMYIYIKDYEEKDEE